MDEHSRSRRLHPNAECGHFYLTGDAARAQLDMRIGAASKMPVALRHVGIATKKSISGLSSMTQRRRSDQILKMYSRMGDRAQFPLPNHTHDTGCRSEPCEG